MSNQLRGMLLEEAVLFLLQRAGYRTIESTQNDPTLKTGRSGIEVRGRGMNHQIDAIADFIVTPPFSHRNRMLLEAKCYAAGSPIEVDVVRNAVGVLKDVSEYWSAATTPRKPRNNRFHYQYAIFSSSGFTAGAVQYAFAQDIYLLPLNSPFFASVLQAIWALSALPHMQSVSSMRKEIRRRLRSPNSNSFDEITPFIQACRDIGGALIGMAGGDYPIFLIPNPNTVIINELMPTYSSIRIRKYRPNFEHISGQDELLEPGWYLEYRGQRIFSFDIPENLLELYTSGGQHSSQRMLDLKEKVLREIQAIVILPDRDEPRIIRFLLDMDWLSAVRQNL